MKQLYAANTEYEILTPNGWEDFDGIFLNQQANRQSRKIYFLDNTFIIATKDHRFFNNKQEVKVADLTVGDFVDSVNGSIEIHRFSVFTKYGITFVRIGIDFF